MRYVWDTSVLVHCLKKSGSYQALEAKFRFFDSDNQVFISIVTVAVLYSLARQRQWENKKLTELQQLLLILRPIPIHNKALVDAYVELDVFSQGKNPLRPLASGLSARNMGKNDLWIAATTVAVEGKLVTFDRDFEHLHQDWFEVVTPF